MKTLAGFTGLCMIAAAQVSLVQLQHPPAPFGNGVIEGTVVNQITHEPMKKVAVTLMGMISLNAVTDASGHFAFKDLAAGQYTLEAGIIANGGPRRNANRIVDLTADEQLTDLTLSVAPPASISGRVVDETGAAPPQGCNISAIAMLDQNGRKVPVVTAIANSDASGNYQFERIAPGKYFVMASCHVYLPLPHPLMDRGSPDIPMARYPALLYPGSTTIENARRITAPAGANISGIDFQVTPTAGVTIKGQLHAATPEWIQGVVITLRLNGDLGAMLPRNGARVDPQSGTFHISGVAPGSYQLVATSGGGYAQTSLNIGSAAPEPIELTLGPIPTISGSLRIEGDGKLSTGGRDIYLRPLENQELHGPTNGHTKEDGTFNITGLSPGKWSLSMNGDGYIKSMQLNDQDANPENLVLASGAPNNAVRIVVGNEWAQLDGTVATSTQGAHIAGVLLRDPAEDSWGMYNRQFFGGTGGHFHIRNVAPGKYRVCAIENPVAMQMLMQNLDLRNKIRTRCEAVEVEEGGHATVQLTAISRDDFERLLAELEDQ